MSTKVQKSGVSTSYVNLRSAGTRFAAWGNILDRGGGAVGTGVCVLGGADGAGCGWVGRIETVAAAEGKKETP